jgi:hypothetical protein
MTRILSVATLALAACSISSGQAVMRAGCAGATFQPIAADVLAALFPQASVGIEIETLTVHQALAAYCRNHGGGRPVMKMER